MRLLPTPPAPHLPTGAPIPPVKRYLKFQPMLYTEHPWELGQHGLRVKYRALKSLSRHAPFISNTTPYTCNLYMLSTTYYYCIFKHGWCMIICFLVLLKKIYTYLLSLFVLTLSLLSLSQKIHYSYLFSLLLLSLYWISSVIAQLMPFFFSLEAIAHAYCA